MCYDQVIAFGMLVTERSEIFGIKIVGGPFAFDSHRLFSAIRNYEVHFVSAFISPVRYVSALKSGHNFIQNKMFPQDIEVIVTQFLPATVVADEAGIKAIDLGRGNNLRWATTAKGPNHVSNKMDKRRMNRSERWAVTAGS